MSFKFLSETNVKANQIMGVLSEATNIANAKIAGLIRDLRRAIDSNDRSGEAAVNKLLNKEMVAVAKPIMSEFSKNLAAFIKVQEKELSNKHGMEVVFVKDGKPVLSMGNADYQCAVKSIFSYWLMVNPPEVKDTTPRNALTGEPAGDSKVVGHGFDLTSFDTASNFIKVLKSVGIEPKARQNADGAFIWEGPGITMTTGNNPITGEYMTAGRREPEEGYASYIGIEGEKAKVKKLADQIRKYDPKDESPGSRDFI